jgi:hypothetical protein
MIAKIPTIAACRLQVSHRPAVRLSAQRPGLRLELPAHVLCGAVRGVQGQPDPGARHGPHLHPARRPRAERLHLDGALAGSSGANPFACIAAGIACLWGPAHGGANEAVLNMLNEIGTVDRIPEFIARAKDKDDPFRLMGFGHRVYKNYDPRAKIMQKTCARGAHENWASRTTRCSTSPWNWSDCAEGRILRREEAIPEHRFLLGHHAARAGLPDVDVHGAVLGRPHRRLDRPVEGNDRGPDPAHRPPAPALHRPGRTRLRAGITAPGLTASFRK